MLVPMHWLKQYIPVPWTAQELAQRLTAAGLKVEEIQQFGAGVTGVITARILAVRPHPNAERLVICDVDTGSAQVSVVTGAPNVAAGQVAPLAMPGARVKGATKPLAAATLRGVPSHGMLCAEDELGISDDHVGIMQLPADTALGVDVCTLLHLGDDVLEFEIYPNRPDCLCVLGIAREAAAQLQQPVTLPLSAPKEAGTPAAALATVEVAAPDLCPRYCARIIKGVKIGPSPLWMQQHLRAAGMRPINNVVDVTNYVMLEMGQPLHAFDLSLVHDSRIVVRRAGAGEKLTTLDGQERVLTPEMLVIADGARAVAVAGVMGGENSEIRPETTDILLESANFDAVGVRKTARNLGLRTEASQRFEKGLDPHLAPLAADRAAYLLAELCGGTVAPGMIDVAAPLPPATEISLRAERVNAILGTALEAEQIAGYLRNLGFAVSQAAAEMRVTVPTYRRDVTREIDLIEEVARLYTYDEVPATLPRSASTPGGQSREARLLDKVRTACAAAGLSESITYSFTSPRHFDMLQLPADDPRRKAIRLLNPLSEEQSVMRTTILGNLLDATARNIARQNSTVHLFELGAVFIPQEWPPVRQPSEPVMLAIALCGVAPGAGWGEQERQTDFYDLKSVLERVGRSLRVEFGVAPGRHPSLHPGRTAEISVGAKVVGYMGQAHPRVQEAFDIPTPVYMLEINMSEVLPFAGGLPKMRPLVRYPAVRRDLALLAPLSVNAAEVEGVLRSQIGEALEDFHLFDVYQGKQMPAGYRSLAYALTLRSAERTMTDAEVSEALAKAETALSELGVTLRR